MSATEVLSRSTAKYDLTHKRRAYKAMGVCLDTADIYEDTDIARSTSVSS